VPFAAIVLFFTEEKKSNSLKKHIKYWNFLFFAYIIARFIVTAVLPLWFLSGFLFIIYAWIAGYLWYKAYVWEDMDIEYIDKFEEKIKEKL
jgi:hypothetical protein